MSSDPSQDDDDLPFSELAPLAPTIGERKTKALSWGSRLWSTVVAVIPVGVLTLMALFTWWLIRNAPEAPAPSVKLPPTHDPDFIMQKFSMRDFDAQGIQRSLIEGSILRHFPDTENVLIEDARISWDDANNIPHHASSKRAWGQDKTKEVKLEENAVVIRKAPEGTTEFRSEQLIVEPQSGWVRSPTAVDIRQSDGSQIQAQAFKYNNQTTLVEFEGRVRGLLPAQARQ